MTRRLRSGATTQTAPGRAYKLGSLRCLGRDGISDVELGTPIGCRFRIVPDARAATSQVRKQEEVLKAVLTAHPQSSWQHGGVCPRLSPCSKALGKFYGRLDQKQLAPSTISGWFTAVDVTLFCLLPQGSMRLVLIMAAVALHLCKRDKDAATTLLTRRSKERFSLERVFAL